MIRSEALHVYTEEQPYKYLHAREKPYRIDTSTMERSYTGTHSIVEKPYRLTQERSLTHNIQERSHTDY